MWQGQLMKICLQVFFLFCNFCRFNIVCCYWVFFCSLDILDGKIFYFDIDYDILVVFFL